MKYLWLMADQIMFQIFNLDLGRSIKIYIHLGATVVVGGKDVGENAHNE